MKYTVLTLFPEIIDAYFAASIMSKAVDRGIVAYRRVNIRDFALDRHKTCDDAPYGGGAGMLMLPEPLGRALESLGVARKGGVGGRELGVESREQGAENGERKAHEGGLPPSCVSCSPLPTPHSPSSVPRPPKPPRVIYLSPSGKPFNQAWAEELAREEELVLLCGRYEGIDQRIIDLYVDDEISIGDYVLSSGETAAVVLIDATYRLVERVISAASLEEESFSGGLLEYPQYTRPEIYATMRVPEVLLSGHHENIRRWRLRKRVEKTLALRPDLVRQGEEAGFFDVETRGMIAETLREGFC